MDIQTYLHNRLIGSSNLTRKSNFGNVKLNLNFLLSKMRCSWEDDHLTIGFRRRNGTELVDDDYEYPVPAFAAKFCQMQGRHHFLAICNEEGTVNILNTNLHGDKTYVSSIRAHENAVFDVCWTPFEASILTVSGDKSIALWDVNEEKKIGSFTGHKGSVKWADFKPMDKNVFATASRDGCVMVWDRRSKKAENAIKNCHALAKTPNGKKRSKMSPLNALRDGNHSVTCVLFQDERTLVSSGSSDGNIKVWDLRKHYGNHKLLPVAKHVISRKNAKCDGYSSLVFDSTRKWLFASSCNNTIYQFDLCGYSSVPVAEFTGHQNRTFFVKSAVSPDDQYLISGSSDNNAYIWAINEPGDAIFKLEGHEAEVTAVAWSLDPVPRIVTCGDDMRFKLWNSWPDGVPVSSHRPVMGHATATPKSGERSTKTPKRPVKVRDASTECRSTPKRGKRRIRQENCHRTPKKPNLAPRDVLSPSKSARNEENIRRKLEFDADLKTPNCKKVTNWTVTSPTMNLPNLAVDSVIYSPKVVRTRRPSRVDWLTEMGKGRETNKATKTTKSKGLRRSTRSVKVQISPNSPTILNYFSSTSTK